MTQPGDVDVDAVAAAVSMCAGVAALDQGRFGEVATYLPGRRVPGIQVHADVVTISVRGRWGVPAAELLSQVLAATAETLRGYRVHLILADLDDPDSGPGRPLATSSPAN
jgi:hypothetical protein